MNVLTLRNQSRLKSGIGSGDYSNADLLTQHNEAYYALASIIAGIDGDYYERQKVSFNLVAGSSLVNLPTDCMRLKQVRLAYTTPTSQSDYRIAWSYDPAQVRNVSSDEEVIATSNPIVDVTGSSIRIKPTPTAAVTSGGQFYYVARPSALVNTGDVPVLPLQFHDAIAVYGAREMAGRYSKWDKYKALDLQWNTFIARVPTELGGRDENEALRMRNPLEDGSSRGNQVSELYRGNGRYGS